MTSTNNKNYFKGLKSLVYSDASLTRSYTSEIILISINNTGNYLVNSRTDKSMRIWKCHIDRLVEHKVIEQAHVKSVECISWDPNHETTFASVGRDEYVKVWRASNGRLEQEIKILKDNNLNPACCQFVSYSYDGKILVVIDKDSTVVFLSVFENFKKIGEIKLHEHIYDIQWFNYNHKFFILALHDGTIPVYEVVEDESTTDTTLTLQEVKLRTKLTGHKSSITSLQVDPRGTYFAAGSNEGVVSIYNTKDMLVNGVISDVDEAISCLSSSRDGTYLGVAFDSGSNIRIYDHASSQEVFEVPNSLGGKLVLPVISWFPNKTAFVHSYDKGTKMTLFVKSD